MHVLPLDKNKYQGVEIVVSYCTDSYYDVLQNLDGFKLTLKKRDMPEEKHYSDTLFSEWLDDPVAFGAFEDNKLIGIVEGSPETWNNRFRINNIVVFDPSCRNKGIGTKLMYSIYKEAVKSGARMIVLETQSCNKKAIDFYTKHGFSLIGLDMYAYSNEDPEKHEVRLEMGKRLF